MQVWNVLHVARWEYRMQKRYIKLPSGHHRTTVSGWIFSTKACIDCRKKKFVKQQYFLHMSPQYDRPTSGWDWFRSLGHPCKFQRVSHLGFVTATTLFTGGQPNFAGCWAFAEGATYIWLGGHHVGHRPSAHILVLSLVSSVPCQEIGWEERLQKWAI